MPTPAFSIQPLEPADYPTVRELSRSLGRRSAPERFAPGGCLLGATSENGRLVGWAKAQWWDPQDPVAPAGYYLGGVEVDRRWRRRGVATALGLARLRWVAQRADAAWCVVNTRNSASLALQRRLGFTVRARAASFGTVEFTGGAGLLLCRPLEEFAPRDGADNDEQK
ncbi:GNAT family N-acetyltransferase [Glutamicibacter protophormiae]|uniref:GNAT family N-acetyltransferase n=1 Tax=Glutamicibacter protophormiae TaxID=37930 RepID=UPI00195D827B|nr:GNAT family N-acetyltransferase [Glutamicibacter protophormiae]QRQ77369.1 GNAT family N-acetyltransferase [Glutamicibacter protophormiae]